MRQATISLPEVQNKHWWLDVLYREGGIPQDDIIPGFVWVRLLVKGRRGTVKMAENQQSQTGCCPSHRMKRKPQGQRSWHVYTQPQLSSFLHCTLFAFPLDLYLLNNLPCNTSFTKEAC